jgi:hypothetical protein
MVSAILRRMLAFQPIDNSWAILVITGGIPLAIVLIVFGATAMRPRR